MQSRYGQQVRKARPGVICAEIRSDQLAAAGGHRGEHAALRPSQISCDMRSSRVAVPGEQDAPVVRTFSNQPRRARYGRFKPDCVRIELCPRRRIGPVRYQFPFYHIAGENIKRAGRPDRHANS